MKSALKTILKIVVTVAVIFFAFLCILSIVFTSWKGTKVNNLNVYYSKLTNSGTAGHYEWDGNTENMTVIIPDEVEGEKIDSLGGAVGRGAPVLFHIIMPENVKFDEEYNFTVKLGKNIKYAHNFLYSDEYTDYRVNVLYKVNYYYECSEDNKRIYSKDGKLYDKKTDELLGDIYS